MVDAYRSVLWTGFALIAVYTVQIIRRWRYMRLEQFADMPQLGKTSLIWGHLALLRKLFEEGDPRRHIDNVLLEVSREQGNPPVMLIDMRPIQYPMLVICHAEVAEQLTRASSTWSSSTPKSPTLSDISHLTGSTSIITAEGEQWRIQRKRLSPGFAPQHLLSTSLPIILDKTKLFIGHLDRHADAGTEFSADVLLTNLTFDIIGAITMGHDFKAQITGEESEILKAFVGLSTLMKGKPVISIPGSQWRRTWKINRLARRIELLTKDIVRREFKRLALTGSGVPARSVLGLSLQDITELTPELLKQTSDNLRVFMFAGHDTTSILMQWVFWELTRAPRQRAALFAELDALFGTDVDPDAIAAQLLGPSGAELLSAMTYGTAVIKETLRLHPPAATVRMTAPGTDFHLALPDGKRICVDGTIMYINAFVIQRDAGSWGETVDDFVPERWLGDTSWMVPGAWRPFERGPRSCIGMELANVESRVILALVSRRYDFTKVGQGELELDGEGQPVMNEKGQYKVKSELFSTAQVTSKPVDGTMMKVKLSERATAKT